MQHTVAVYRQFVVAGDVSHVSSRRETDTMTTTVREMMDTNPVTIAPDATIDQAIDLLVRMNAGSAYVIEENGLLVGVVTDYELLKARLVKTAGDNCIDCLINRATATLSPETSAIDAALLLRDGRYGRVAVAENGCLIGQLSRNDVLRLLYPLDQSGGDSARVSGNTATPPASVIGKPQYLRSRQSNGLHSTAD
jgi:CBS domain-containing protein